ncbi:DEAD/DEAH box helicase [Frankia sp. Cj3]|uniref:DEAD/DEAH box helicase n=1 Tax=Frankia sp. Cj3 TaxID=2880976 RepID=UPI001EF623FF|nr:DEAD/DEAH box helicase [Frankia sp. Cj3]
MGLRPYQREAIDAVYAKFREGVNRPAIILPTGSGKTVLLAHMAAENDGRTLILAHRRELIDQAEEKVRSIATGRSVGVEMAGRKAGGAEIVIASVQTMSSKKRMNEWVRDAFSLVIVDECHHVLGETYMKVLDHFGCMKKGGTSTLGVTATLARGDGVGLGSVWQDVAYSRSILDMVAGGYLVNPRGLSVPIGLDLSQVDVAHGDYAAGSLGEALTDANFDTAVAQAYITHGEGKPGLVFTPTVATAQAAAQALRAEGVKADAVWGDMDTDARHAAVNGLRDGELDVLCNCQLLTEGTDIPRAEVAIMARPTRSATLFCFDAQTEVLTPSGWVMGRTVSVGDTISTFNPDTDEVAWGEVLGYVERELLPGERMMSIDTPMVDVRVTDTHRMVWMPKKAIKWHIDTAGHVAQATQDWKLPAAGFESFPGIPLADCDLALIGWVQTDGCINKTTGCIQISQQRTEQIEHIEKTLDACGFKWRKSVNQEPTNFGPRRHPIHIFRVSRGQPRGSDKHLTGWGRLSPFMPKDDPDAWGRLAEMTVNQWRVFMDAWHRGDGSKQEGQAWVRRGYHLAISDKRVADWVQAQCMRRGWRANIQQQADLWMVHCREVATRSIGGTSRKGDRPGLKKSPSWPGEQVWCVSVPTGAILTRRNGKGAIIGQTQMAGRVLRPYPGKTGALLIDLVGVTADKKLCTLLDLASGQLPERSTKDALEDGETLTDAVERITKLALGPAKHVDLFGASASVWLQTKKGHWFIPAAGGYVAIYSKGEQHAVALFPPGGDKPRFSSSAVSDLTLAMALGEERAHQADRESGKKFSTTSRDARWRSKRQLTDGQIATCERMHIEIPPGATSGDVSDMISIKFASQRIDRHFARWS